MTDADPRRPGAEGDGHDDPVAAARAWLLRNGGVLPPEPAGGHRLDEAAASSRSGPGSGSRQPPGSTETETETETDTGLDGSRGRKRKRGAANQQPDVDSDPEAVARGVVLRKLAVQARTRHELTKAIAAKEVPAEVADRVLDRMEAVGLVDDAAFARDWVESRQQRRHLSRSALRRELQTKGVERELIEDAVGEVDGGDELVAARELAERKLRSMSGLSREVQYRRLAGALARRGFGPGVAAPVLRAVLDTDPDR